MTNRTPSLDLMEYVETQILPQYAEFDSAHGISHATRVIKRSLELAATTGADVDMAYAIAAYHDIGMAGPRAVHHITGGKILAADKKLRKWFSEEQIRLMKEAVEDHRASASRAPRSIYGKIVAEADRDIVPEQVFRRTVQFGFANYPQLNREQHWQRFQQHMHDKYSAEGYIRLWIPGSPNERKLAELRETIADEEALRREFDKYFMEEHTKRVIEHFKEQQPDVDTELQFASTFQLLVAVVLSAQCTDKRVNEVTPALFRAYPDAQAMAQAEAEDVLPYIKSVSYPNSKAQHITDLARRLVEKHGGNVPEDIDELLMLPGVGRKTANVMLAVAFGQAAMPVDTHVFRVSHRMGLVTPDANTPLKVEQQLTQRIAPGDQARAHHWLLLHGRYVCTSRKPHCDSCELAAICPKEGV